MTSLLQKTILFSLIPVFMMIIGGIIAIYKKPGGNARSLILHFAAGVVFSVVAVEILPDVIKQHKPVQVVIGFALGLITMLFIKRFAETNKKEEEGITGSKLPISLLTGIGVDIFIDGILLGIGFSAGGSAGMLLAFALAIELLSLGMATATELGNNNLSKKKSIIIIIVLAILFFISAMLGVVLLRNSSESTMEIILSFALSALLFLVVEELLTEAHEEKETVWHTSSFFIGFLIFLILGMLV
ncbi:transporter [Chryseobacterium lactis]|uniref:Transporter n=1 Tax=Chryseobacterium lactis TaxID=1241981 RepID=A0A3G6RNN7_CHRLC|nr:transporter [Chryseobacterium lactis]AZA81527.1 transporter [Chryseobacterium lactis]AZB06525.1 transporter [Chryseobacterium lactis]PNW15376.1 transporter [Chryseobacterium lactis]